MSMGKLQSALPDLIGRTIKHIVVSEHEDLRTQLFLFFDDGTYYEFYGGWLNGIRHLSVGDMRIPRAGGYVPAKGRLEIVNATMSTLTERPVVVPVPAAAPIVAIPRRKRWRMAIDSWMS